MSHFKLDNLTQVVHNFRMTKSKLLHLTPKSKIWIVDKDNRILMGGGRQNILEVIERTGSMNKAATELGMSFRTVWGKIRDTERRLGFKLVENRSDSRRGGSKLTEHARQLMKQYEQFNQEAVDAIDDIFQKVFHQTE